MENNVTNATCPSTTNLRQQQHAQQAREPSLIQKLQDQHMQQQQHQQQQQQQQQQQMHQQTSNTDSNTINNNNNSNNIENQQQFCLRWHNHQVSKIVISFVIKLYSINSFLGIEMIAKTATATENL